MAAALTDIRLFGPAGMTFTPATWGPDGVRGVDKVVQRVLYALFTPAGSVPGRPSDGSGFLALARSFRSEFDLLTAWAAAYPAVVATVQAAEAAVPGGEPAGERFGWARVAGVAFTADRVVLQLTVAAADGTLPADPVNAVLSL